MRTALSSTATVSEIRQRKSVVSTVAARRNLNARMGNDMSTIEVDAKYLEKITAFVARLNTALVEGAEKRGEKIEAVSAFYTSGRKLDQIKRAVWLPGKAKSEKMEVIMFVDRATGEIFGAKSPLTKNDKYYFGTLDEIDLWDWSGTEESDQPVPFDAGKAGVEIVKRYGKFNHYAKVGKRRGRPPKSATEQSAPESEPEKIEA